MGEPATTTAVFEVVATYFGNLYTGEVRERALAGGREPLAEYPRTVALFVDSIGGTAGRRGGGAALRRLAASVQALYAACTRFGAWREFVDHAAGACLPPELLDAASAEQREELALQLVHRTAVRGGAQAAGPLCGEIAPRDTPRARLADANRRVHDHALAGAREYQADIRARVVGAGAPDPASAAGAAALAELARVLARDRAALAARVEELAERVARLEAENAALRRAAKARRADAPAARAPERRTPEPARAPEPAREPERREPERREPERREPERREPERRGPEPARAEPARPPQKPGFVLQALGPPRAAPATPPAPAAPASPAPPAPAAPGWVLRPIGPAEARAPEPRAPEPRAPEPRLAARGLDDYLSACDAGSGSSDVSDSKSDSKSDSGSELGLGS